MIGCLISEVVLTFLNTRVAGRRDSSHYIGRFAEGSSAQGTGRKLMPLSSPSFSLPASGRVSRAIEYLPELWRRRVVAIALALGNLKEGNAMHPLGRLL